MNTEILETELASLRATRSEQEWNRLCDTIKALRGGQYPDDWWPKVVLSGLMSEAQLNWR